MKTPGTPTAVPSAADKGDSTTERLRDLVKTRIQAGETVSASDYSAEDRPVFWAAIALLRDELPAITPSWRTLREWHVDGRRLRERTFRLGAAVLREVSDE